MTQTTKTKPKPRKLRGWATYEGDGFSFKPSEQGEPSQLNVRTCKGGKVFTTTSEKEPKQVVHLSIDANSTDPFSQYVDQLQRLGIKPQAEQPMNQKHRLVNEDGMQVFLDAKNGSLTYQGVINLNKCRNWQSEVMRQLQVIVRRLPIEESFKKLIIKLRKGDKQ